MYRVSVNYVSGFPRVILDGKLMPQAPLTFLRNLKNNRDTEPENNFKDFLTSFFQGY